MYKIVSDEFTAPNGEKKRFWYREGTNDRDTIQAAFVEDEYGILGLDFKDGDIVIDIGAHIGAVTLLFTTLRPDLRIFSFEPMPKNFDLLKSNVIDNETENEISISKMAVWFYDEDKISLFYGDNSPSGKTHKNIGSMFMIHDFYHPSLFKNVETISLSKIFEENHIRDCRFMKIDCEGMEYGIFKGTPKEVLAMIERIHGEYHNIDPVKIKKPRKTLLDQTKGVFKDETGHPEKGNIGPFIFIRK